MKEFDRFEEENLPLYNDTAYKILPADKAVDVGLLEVQTLTEEGAKTELTDHRKRSQRVALFL
jgi:hypothetical protein